MIAVSAASYRVSLPEMRFVVVLVLLLLFVVVVVVVLLSGSSSLCYLLF